MAAKAGTRAASAVALLLFLLLGSWLLGTWLLGSWNWRLALLTLAVLLLVCRRTFPLASWQHLLALRALISFLLESLVRVLPSNLNLRGAAPLPACQTISAPWLAKLLRQHYPDMELLGIRVRSSETDAFESNRGLSGAVRIFRVNYETPAGIHPEETDQKTANVLEQLPSSLVLKMIPATLEDKYQNLISGHYREALFYARIPQLARVLSNCQVYWSQYDSALGVWAILSRAEKVPPSLQLNFVFGNQMWGVPDDVQTYLNSRPDAPSQRQCMEAMARRAAKIHSLYWRDPALLQSPGTPQTDFFKARAWFQGQDQLRWEIGFRSAVSGWARRDRENVEWDERLVQLVDEALAKSSFQETVSWLRRADNPWTLTHGDFHAGNALWKMSEKPGTSLSPSQEGLGVGEGTGNGNGNGDENLVLVDWSEVGVWLPAADLAQFLISDVRPAVRREHEEHVLRLYHRSLCQEYRQRTGLDLDFDFEQCKRLYVAGGIDRWTWLLGTLAGWPGLPAAFLQYLHDQVLAFVEDHDIQEIRVRSVGTVEI